MRKFLFLITLILPLAGFAQTDSSKWGLRISLGFHQSSHRLLGSDSTQAFTETLNELEKPSYVTGYGIFLTRQINQKLRAHAGVQYTVLGHRIDSLELAKLHDIRYRYELIEIPLGIQYTIRPTKRVSPIIGLQLQFGKTLAYKWSYRTFDSNTPRANTLEYPANSLYLSATAQAGFRFQLHAKYNLETNVQYQHNFQSMEDSPIERRYRLLGIHLSLVRYF